MLKPKYIEQLPQRMIDLYAEVEHDIISDMARRLSQMDFIPSAYWQYQKLIEMGNFHSYIMEALSSRTGLARREIERLMEEAGVKAISFDTAIYNRAGLKPPPLAASPAMQAVLQSGMDNTFGLFQNLSRTTANTATKQFEGALDRAWLQITSGAFSHTESVRMAVKDLASKGVASITYPTGHTDYLEVAVRRAVVTGVNQTSLKMQDTLADEMGCDLVETSAHAGARPSHAEWQGRIFSRSGTHSKYPDFRQSTGYGTGEGLGGWNCRHSYFPYFEGMAPVYSSDDLEDMNAKKYEYNGEKLTEYEATQKQRYIERQIRRWKREYKVMEAAGQPTNEAAAKLSKWNGTQKDFIEQTGLKQQHEREGVEGFGKGQAIKARAQAARLEKMQREAYNEKQAEVRKLIRSDALPKALNVGSQNKHIPGSKGYILGRSYIYGDLDTAQELVDRYHGTGEARLTRKGDWTNKEYILTGGVLGVVVDPDTLSETATKAGLIHYGKKGTHIVPTKEARPDDT